MRRLLLSGAFLLGLLLPAAGGEMDPLDTRVSAGVFVKLDGRVTTVYLDFVTVPYQEGVELITPVVLTTDIELTVGKQKLPPGKHEWVLTTGDEIAWTLGEHQKSKRDEVTLFPLEVREAPRVDWLTACFQPDPDRGEVLLLVRIGRLQGALRFSLEGATATAAGRGLSAVELRVLRDQLRSNAGLLDTALAPKPWSQVLLSLGDTLIATDPGASLAEIEVVEAGGQVELGIKSALSGEREAAVPLKAALEQAVVGRLFPVVSSPVVRRRSDGVLGFQLTAKADAAEFNKVTEVAALFDGQKPDKLAEEVLLLEERISLLSLRSVSTFEDWSPSLLTAKRKARVIVEDVEPGPTMEEAEGLNVIPVKLTISGSGAGIARFLHSLESEGVPMSIRLDSLNAAKGGARAKLTLALWHAIPLAMRRPDVLRQVREMGLSERFDRLRSLYLKGVGELDPKAFVKPRWERDPFAAPTR